MSVAFLSLAAQQAGNSKLQAGMDLNKLQKQGRDERTHEDYPTSAKYTADVG